ncbi:MAG: hypothetical protein P8J37_03325 [Fuerstiella sp.]|nr:hypothetical protein [Fuerstiella sp.]
MNTHTRPAARPMRKCRFLTGLTLSTCGVATMLMVAAGTLQNHGINGRLSLPAVGLCMIVGLMLLGGGFGIMATSAATFDDQEFDRLMEAGNLPDSPPLDSSCNFELTDHVNDDVCVTDNSMPTPETQADLMNLPRVDYAESGESRLNSHTSGGVPAPQTSV